MFQTYAGRVPAAADPGLLLVREVGPADRLGKGVAGGARYDREPAGAQGGDRDAAALRGVERRAVGNRRGSGTGIARLLLHHARPARVVPRRGASTPAGDRPASSASRDAGRSLRGRTTNVAALTSDRCAPPTGKSRDAPRVHALRASLRFAASALQGDTPPIPPLRNTYGPLPAPPLQVTAPGTKSSPPLASRGAAFLTARPYLSLPAASPAFMPVYPDRPADQRPNAIGDFVCQAECPDPRRVLPQVPRRTEAQRSFR